MSTGSSYPSFLFDPLRHWLDQLPPRPDSAALAALAEQHPRHVASGQRIRFVPPQDDGKAYECRIWERGEVETRPDNWHDFFNALVWLSFPHTKNAISAAHVRAMQQPGELRGRVRDALTHFDECGIVVLSVQRRPARPVAQFSLAGAVRRPAGGRTPRHALHRIRPCHLRSAARALPRPDRQGLALPGG